MEVEFRTTAADYVAFYRYFFFQRKLTVRIVYWSLLSIFIGAIFHSSVFGWGYVITVLGIILAVALFLFEIPYLVAIRRLQKALALSDKVGQPRRMVLTAEGFSLQWTGEGMENEPMEHYRLETIKAVEENGLYVFVLQYHKFPLVIPKSSFPANDAISNFIGVLSYGRVSRGGGQESDWIKSGRIAYLGLLGVIPMIGAVAGVVLFILGIIYKSTKLIVIGAADILVTIIFWVVFFTYFIHRVFNSPSITNMERQFAQGQLNSVFRNVEFYKLQHGQYPDSLPEIMDPKGNVWITDPLAPKSNPWKTHYFYYEKMGEKYWLFSVGEDGKPFTADDIYPEMNPADSVKFGLRVQ